MIQIPIHSAGQGISYEDQAMNQDDERDLEVLLPLENNVSNYNQCLSHGRTLGFINIKDLDKHFKEQDAQTTLIYRFRGCMRYCHSLASWHCHKTGVYMRQV